MAQIQDKNQKKANEKILEIARNRFQLAESAEAEIRKLALEDLEFRAGEQWPEEVRQERAQDFRPCLTINRIPQFIRQITNDQRQNRPSIKVFPVDEKADIETAKILQGLIRHIEYNSNADVAYDTAFEGAATKGFGYFRVITDYVDPMTFEQEILIKRIGNSFTVYKDPYSKEPDGSDMNWCFIVDSISKDDYIAEYGETDLAAMSDWTSIGDQNAGWMDSSSCRIAEYFYKDFKTVILVQLSTGETIEKSMLPEELPPGITIVNERRSSIPTIKWCKINGVEIIEETEWKGKWIPLIPVYGDELDVNGKKILEGVIRHAKDSQRMYNYWASTETETIALAPKAPYIVAEGQVEGFENIWANANRKNQAFLPYKPISSSGQLVGAPQRNVYEPAVQAITNARLQASEDLKATTGIYDAALGSRGGETSGVAIQRRNLQSQTSNFHFIDNLTRSLRHTGRIIVDLIPHIYDTPRASRILGEDGEQEIVKINQLFIKDGKEQMFDFSVGKYDVAIETGPSFATKRQEALASMIDLTRNYPQMVQVAGDLLVKNMDWPGAQEIAERLKKTLPPNVLDQKENNQLPPEAKAQMDQMSQLIEQLTNKLNEANDAIKTKSVEIESKERIEFAKMEVDLKKELLKQQGSAALETYKMELQEIQNRLNLLDINQPFDSDEQFQDQESDQFQYQNLNGSGPEQAAIQNENQQPTGGLTPGQPVEL